MNCRVGVCWMKKGRQKSEIRKKKQRSIPENSKWERRSSPSSIWERERPEIWRTTAIWREQGLVEEET